ncbi:DUF1972 domain-containing protein [Flagellimonas flava]|uniref:Glycosyltransferase involved in cell wall bisynthesis n=1 Tax=Flagellimonas flava TaxID=570519 RepID=A0A1M5L1X3_9FLAO|nr:DUF1972 domain-containing protein [Allomuricauda flava]SHG58986.1 Glycosyltransferase involved in cell wall bisynthesis [Allomuricauda flava]
MKIAVLGIRGLPANYSGFETCANHTTKHWVEDGHDVLVYCRKHLYPQRDRYTKDGVSLVYLSSLPIKSLETLSHTFFSIIHLCFFRRDFKIVHLYNCGNGLFIPLLKLLGKKVFISVDGLEWKRKKWGRIAKSMYKLGAYMSVKFADKIVVDNKVVQDFYLNRFKKDTELIAYGAKIIANNTPDNNTVLDAHQLKKNNYFIFVGRFVKEKGVQRLIESYLQLNTSMPLVIIGDDVVGNEYRDHIFNTYSEHPKIHLLGYKFGDEYEALLSNALLYVSASELEGTSPSLLAAMGAKVCTLVQGIEENLATVGDSGSVFLVNDYQDLTKKWQNFVDKPDLVDEMAEKGFQHVLKNYNWKVIAKQYLSLFK